jgi:hypothetical protein
MKLAFIQRRPRVPLHLDLIPRQFETITNPDTWAKKEAKKCMKLFTHFGDLVQTMKYCVGST